MPNTKTSAKKKAATSLLPAAAMEPKHLVDIGSRFPVSRLDKLCDAVMPKIEHHDFSRFGLGPDWVAAIDSLRAEIAASQSAAAAVRDESVLPSGEALDAAVAAAKNWRRDASTCVHMTPTLRDD